MTYPFLQGGGEMGELTRDFDWYTTSIGTPDEWPHSLQITVSNILRSKFPMFLWWGKDMIQFYNDAYRPSLGNEGKHPSALGAKGADTWPEIWDIISPLHRQVESTGEATWRENQLVSIYRNGRLEDVYWTFSYSSVLDDEGNHGGILVTCMETTESVMANQRIEKSQHELLQLFEESPVAIATLSKDKDLVFEYANRFYGTVVGRKPEEILGKPLLEALPEIVGQGFDHLLNDVIKTGRPFVAKEVAADILRTGKIETIYVDLTYQPRREQDGSIGGILVVATDVSEQVRARKKIEESEAKLRSILNSTPTAIGVFVGPDLVVENPNQLLIDVLAAGPDIEGKSFRQLLSGLVEQDQKFVKIIDSVRRTGQPFEAQEVVILFKAENKTRYFNINFIPLIDQGGAVYAVLDVSVDVTTQVLNRQQLAAGEAKFRLLIEEAPFATAFYTGPELTIDIVNDAMLQLWDKPSSIVGKTFELALPELDGQPFTGLLKNVYHTGIEYVAKGQSADIMIKGQMQRGWYNFNYKPIRNEKGEVYGIVHMAVDVTEQVLGQKKIEENEAALATALEQLRLSKEAAELGTFDMNLKAGTMHWDERCRILFGISHQEPVTFENDFVKGLHPNDSKRILAVIDKAFKKSESDGDYDVEYRTIGAEDKTERWVKAKGKVYFDEEETPVRFIGSVLDITAQMTAMQQIEKLVEERTKELGQANEALKTINKELQRSNANLEEFAHAASHDLKEPVRKIHFFTSQLKQQLSSHVAEGELRLFNRIENASKRMGNLIDDLLLYSHVSQRPHETEVVDLNEQIHRVLEDLDLDIEEKKATIKIEGLPVVNGYRRQLQQLFQNLISNALKYSKAALPPLITITAELSENNGRRYHRIKVADNGIGFEPEYAEKIFQMFTRLHGKTEYSGTGVGLSIVKKVVENHDGFIDVESKLDEGSVFKIYLPV